MLYQNWLIERKQKKKYHQPADRQTNSNLINIDGKIVHICNSQLWWRDQKYKKGIDQ